MHNYDPRERPPAPFVDVRIANIETGASLWLRAKLDTGASVSVIPESARDALRIDPKGEARFTGYDGAESVRDIYYINIEVEGLRLPSVRMTASRRRDVLLGRDILNHFIVTLDGKAQTFEMVDP